jgi:hypothetical protein
VVESSGSISAHVSPEQVHDPVASVAPGPLHAMHGIFDEVFESELSNHPSLHAHVYELIVLVQSWLIAHMLRFELLHSSRSVQLRLALSVANTLLSASLVSS